MKTTLRDRGMRRVRYARTYGRAVKFTRRRRNGRFSSVAEVIIPENTIRGKNGTFIVGRNLLGAKMVVDADRVNWETVRMV